MEPLILLIVLVFLFLIVVLPIWAMVRASSASGKLQELEELKRRVARLEQGLMQKPSSVEKASPGSSSEEPPAPAAPPIPEEVIPAMPVPASPAEPAMGMETPPPLPAPEPVLSFSSESSNSENITPSAPPPIPAQPLAVPAPASIVSKDPAQGSFNWEKFLGTKFIAWIGGVALFLGLVYLVIESIQRGWIPPWLRATGGGVIGLGLIAAGVRLHNAIHKVTAQTLTGTGIVTLLAVVYACRAFYHFPLFTTPFSFVLMVGITAGAFGLAGYMRAQVVAVLGLLAGFATPILVSTGQDAPVGLFSYLSLLTIGILFSSGRFRWPLLSPLSGLGFVVLYVGWFFRFVVDSEWYESPPGVLIPMTVALLFPLLHIGCARLFRDSGAPAKNMAWTSLVLALLAFVPGIAWVMSHVLQEQLWIPFVYLFIASTLPLLSALINKRAAPVLPLVSVATGILLMVWLNTYFHEGLLIEGILILVIFSLIHNLLPVALQKRGLLPASQVRVPVGVLLSMVLPLILVNAAPVSILSSGILISLVMLVATLASIISRNILSMIIASLLGAFFLVMVFGGRELALFEGELTLLLFFACVFAAASAGISKWFLSRIPKGHSSALAQTKLLGASSALMPVILLLMIMERGVETPSIPMAALLVLGFIYAWTATRLRLPALIASMLIGSLAVEHLWIFSSRFEDFNCGYFAWPLYFSLFYTAIPFACWERWRNEKFIWLTAALSLPLHYAILMKSARIVWLSPSALGLLPLLLLVPTGLGLYFLVRKSPRENPARKTQLACFGGAVLFFVTLIFPAQLDHNWLTISWAFEAAALCWLTRRIPHKGLSALAYGLLAVVFLRLLLGEEIWGDYFKGILLIPTLYTYGLVVAGFFMAAWQLSKTDRNLQWHPVLIPILRGLGLFLVFVWMNIAIADYFTPADAARLNLNPTGRWSTAGADTGWARGMTFTLAWGLFALAMLAAGIWKRISVLRWVALALLGVTLGKLFLFDLAGLKDIYRIIALIGTALVSIGASLLYQRFMNKKE